MTHHVLITRFNLPTVGQESIVRADPGWLQTRWGLFQRFCLPSVRSQTVQDFQWLVYLDPQSPQWLIDAMDELSVEGTLIPRYRTVVEPETLRADLDQITARDGGRLLTTNLDNDDGLAADFVARLRDAERDRLIARPDEPRFALYLVAGLIRLGDRALYEHTDRTNAFCSVSDIGEAATTCWSNWHTLLGRDMPAVEVGGGPAWLQVVHGTNVSNRVHGSLTDPARHHVRFTSLVDDLPTPATSTLLLDRGLLTPARRSWEIARSVSKAGLFAVGGKSALDRVKPARAAARSRIRTARRLMLRSGSTR